MSLAIKRIGFAIWAICLLIGLGYAASNYFYDDTDYGPPVRKGDRYNAPESKRHPSRFVAKFDLQKAHYVGIDKCVPCHEKRVESYRHTRHFLTSRPPTDVSMMGDHREDRNVLRTRNENLWYELNKKDGAFHFSAVEKTESGEARHTEQVAHVLGSGKIATVLTYWKGDQLFQLPAGHFARLKGLANCPGFPDGQTSFDKPIVARCLDCHATHASLKEGRINAYDRDRIMLGISCERCHGPGSEHVRYHERNPNTTIAAHIVAPSSLTRGQRLQQCGLCHGDPGKLIRAPFSYIPGQPLESYVLQEEAALSTAA